MEPSTALIRRVEINSGKEQYILTLNSEDFSALYPGWSGIHLPLQKGERTIAVFRTNSYEYSPLVPLSAEEISRRTADEWEREIRYKSNGICSESRPEIAETCCSPSC